jgi:hypothetical protein
VEVEERLRDAIASRAPFVGLYLPEEALSVTST